MASGQAQLLRNFIRRINERRSQRKCLCRCPNCEQAVPLHQRENLVSILTACNHKRLNGVVGPAYYSTDAVIASFRAALGLDLATQLTREANNNRDDGAEERSHESEQETDLNPGGRADHTDPDVQPPVVPGVGPCTIN